MNDWPADPRLDDGLKRLVDAELAAARTDAVGLTKRPAKRGNRAGGALAGLGTLAVIAIVLSLFLRGTTGRSPGGGSDASASPSLATSAVASEAPTSGATDLATPTPVPTPEPSPLAAGSGTFSPTGDMTSSDNGSATLLLDGRVLIVGNGATSPELYDPKTGRFTSTGPAAIDGNFATATRLADGRVLFVGGNNDKTTFATAQIYDPATGKFSATGSLIQGRMGHTATLLADGRVLIAGGSTFNYASKLGSGVFAMPYLPGTAGSGANRMTGPDMLASAELYDPATGKFTRAGSMTTGRDLASATLLSDGRVLIAGGGNEGNGAVASAELFDPKTGKFAATGSMLVAQYAQSATLLLDGRVLLSGGNDGNQPLTSLEIYDPTAGKFSAAGSGGRVGGFGGPALLHDGRVLFVGGFDVNKGKGAGYLASCDLFDPSTGELSATGSMSTGRIASSVTTLLDGRVLVAGGVNGGDPNFNLTSAELYQP